uniref:Putative monoacylglycerol lipase abhd12 n=1 Tax=Corethrella appendiculata TaxID=1370023 RepID=U5ETP8_9DIPT
MTQFKIDKIIDTIFHSTLMPGLIILLWLTELIFFTTLKLLLIAWFIIFVICPLVFKFSIALQKGILFLTFITYPPDLDFKRPEKSGLYATRNFYVDYKDQEEDIDIKIGVWHILPNNFVKKYAKQLQLEEEILTNVTDIETESDTNSNSKYLAIDKLFNTKDFDLADENFKKELFEESLKTADKGIIFYMHGNTASRGATHRVDIYKVFRSLNYHVVTIDYRGYGDSSNISPSERGIVFDSLAVYQYITTVTNKPVFFWGHSLGTGVATHLLSILNDLNIPGPKAVVLEAPFNNIRDEITHHPFSILFRNLPWFDYTILTPMYENNLRFESDKHIAEFRQPILILHAEDDRVIPFKLGYKLYRQALDTRGKSWGPVQFHRFEKSSHYGHKFIWRAPELPNLINDFFNAYRNTSY